MDAIRRKVEQATEQQVTFIPMVLHRKLVDILTECGAKRGKSVQQLISDAVLEKADKLYYEDHPDERR